MNAPIRLSPSGPKIGNGAGGFLTFGSGAVLRQVKDVEPFTTAPLTGAPIVLPLAVSMGNAMPGLKYSARVDLDLVNTGAGSGVVELALETSADTGATWQQRAAATCSVGGTGAGDIIATHLRLEFPTFLAGSTIGVADSQLDVRVVIAAPSGAAIVVSSVGVNGTAALSLEEVF